MAPRRAGQRDESLSGSALFISIGVGEGSRNHSGEVEAVREFDSGSRGRGHKCVLLEAISESGKTRNGAFEFDSVSHASAGKDYQ